MADASNLTPNSSSPDAPALIYSSDYTIRALTIITSDGTVIDIKTMAVEINIYEDIFAACVTGSILMGDALDLVANFKLHGNEYVIIDIDKPSLNKPISKTFRIYKISNREFTNPTMQNYMIHFISEEMILSTQRYLSKSYKGMAIADMVNDILVNQLGTNKNRINFMDKTDGIFNIIVPRMNPLQAIEWLSTRAYSSKGSLYMFFENRDGYNFESIETIMAQPVYQSYYRRPKTASDPTQTLNSINYLKIIQDFDIITSGRYGAYNATLLTYDLVNQKMTGSSLVYGQHPLLNDVIPVNGAVNRFNQKLTDNPDYFVKFYPSIDSDPSTNGAHPGNWLHKKAMRLAQLHTFKMVVTIPGDVMLKAGTIVQVEIPMAVVQEGNPAINKMRTGKYLVSAVHHVFHNDQMATVMELLSDSMTGSLNEPTNSSQGLQAIKRS